MKLHTFPDTINRFTYITEQMANNNLFLMYLLQTHAYIRLEIISKRIELNWMQKHSQHIIILHYIWSFSVINCKWLFNLNYWPHIIYITANYLWTVIFLTIDTFIFVFLSFCVCVCVKNHSFLIDCGMFESSKVYGCKFQLDTNNFVNWSIAWFW